MISLLSHCPDRIIIIGFVLRFIHCQYAKKTYFMGSIKGTVSRESYDILSYECFASGLINGPLTFLRSSVKKLKIFLCTDWLHFPVH